uniref:Uncharacterized protein n=1 Tax=Romanomermis culicivorax TaxID=13658 RepID=A0A915HHJ5_ROMCU
MISSCYTYVSYGTVPHLMETPHLVRSFLGLQSDPYEPGFDVQFTTYLQKYTDFRPHNFAIYFFHTFMGFVFTIPETNLMDELGIEKIIYKPMKDKSRQKNYGGQECVLEANFQELGTRNNELRI